MSTIISNINGKTCINGKQYDSKKIIINGTNITVDGKNITELFENIPEINIIINGNTGPITCNGDLEINGDVTGDVNANGKLAANIINGDAYCNGEMHVTTLNGNLL